MMDFAEKSDRTNDDAYIRASGNMFWIAGDGLGYDPRPYAISNSHAIKYDLMEKILMNQNFG